MSGLHFAVVCGAQGCRVVDRKSSNGTFLNSAKIQDAMLANGDEIKGGQTIFAVKIVADAKLASLLPYRNTQVGLKLCYRDSISHQTSGRETGYCRM